MGRRRPGQVRDAILEYLEQRRADASVAEIQRGVAATLQAYVSPSSVRSYLSLNTPQCFERTASGRYRLRSLDGVLRLPKPNGKPARPAFTCGAATFYKDDCRSWLASREACSIHGVVTDPPYGLVEYTPKEQVKLRNGRGGVWRIPPSFDGHQRSPVPRFTTLSHGDICNLVDFFYGWGKVLLPVLVPGAHVFIASNPLLSYIVAATLVDAGFERRGEIVRLVMTLRGGDRPKNAHDEFHDVTVMPRSMWEPWLLFRKPIEGRVQDNLRKWYTGGLRRPSADRPFGDVIQSHKAPNRERSVAPHPTLKPQSFLRTLVYAVLPIGKGTILDPFAGSGSTLAAANALGSASIGIDSDQQYVRMARHAVPLLAQIRLK